MISVIMPVYNNETYVSKAIESVLNQTIKDLELIIINDGSTDNTESVIKNYNDDRIKYYYQKNSGPGAARNYGMSLSKGEFIAFIDSDDMYKPNKLEEQLYFLSNNSQYSLVYCEAEVIDSDGNYVADVKSDSNYTIKEDMHAFMLFRQVIPVLPAIMIRRESYDAGFKYDESLFRGDDYDFVLKLSEKFNFYYLPLNLYKYRRHTKNITNEQAKMEDGELKVLSQYSDEDFINKVNASNFSEFDKSLLLAKIFIKLSKYNKAIEILNQIKDKFNSPLVWFYMGNCNYVNNDYKNAINCYTKSVDIDSNMAEAYNNMGCAYAKLNNGKALESFNKALSIRPEYKDVQYNISEIQNNKNNYKITMRELRKSLMIYN